MSPLRTDLDGKVLPRYPNVISTNVTRTQLESGKRDIPACTSLDGGTVILAQDAVDFLKSRVRVAEANMKLPPDQQERDPEMRDRADIIRIADKSYAAAFLIRVLMFAENTRTEMPEAAKAADNAVAA